MGRKPTQSCSGHATLCSHDAVSSQETSVGICICWKKVSTWYVSAPEKAMSWYIQGSSGTYEKGTSTWVFSPPSSPIISMREIRTGTLGECGVDGHTRSSASLNEDAAEAAGEGQSRVGVTVVSVSSPSESMVHAASRKTVPVAFSVSLPARWELNGGGSELVRRMLDPSGDGQRAAPMPEL